MSTDQQSISDHIKTLQAVRSVFDGIPEPCDERAALDAAISLCRATAEQAGKVEGIPVLKPDDGNGDDDAYNRGWNACRDFALAKPTQPAATRQPVAGPTDADVISSLRTHIDSDYKTQAAFALRWKVSASYVSDVMNGRREIPEDWVFAIGFRKAGWERFDTNFPYAALSAPVSPSREFEAHGYALDAIYGYLCAGDNQDIPLEEWPAKIVAWLADAGWAVVPTQLPFAVLGEAAMAGVFETGNPKHGWDYLLAKTRVYGLAPAQEKAP